MRILSSKSEKRKIKPHKKHIPKIEQVQIVLYNSYMKKKRRKLKWWVQSILTAIVLVVAFSVMKKTGCLMINRVEGSSMLPNFVTDNIVITTNLLKIDRYEVVTATTPTGTEVIKRVIGLPGETVSYDGKHIYVNGELTDESFTYDGSDLDKETEEYVLSLLKGSVTLGDDEYFLVGDNRGNSTDSRAYGAVKASMIHGRVIAKDN